MSKYEDYDNASRNYDNQRLAMGSDVIAAMIQFQCGKPLKDLHILDAGCGTGNYAKALVEYGVGSVTLLDASRGMLDKAKEKLADEIKSEKIKDVVEATMPPLPFPDASFDAVMFNLVLHHLDKTDHSKEFANATEALKEAARVVKDGGVVIISTVLPTTIANNVWYSQLNLKLTERFNKLCSSIENYEEMLKVSGLKCYQKMNMLGTGLLMDYCNLEGPLDKNWRDTVSYWKFATPEELEEVQQKIRELKKEGKLEEWVRQHNRVNTAGFLTILFCTKQTV